MSKAFFVLALAAILAGCQSKPELKQVDSGAEAKPINTPAMAAELKQKYERK